ncbi:hypothetical protein [Cupriavidus nantongensis]|nr:hypothetical protein [Cupriavidus nantongensis]
MTKFFDKKLEEELGTGAALQIAGMAAELGARIETYNALQKANGMPTLDEEWEEAEDYVRQMVARGEARREDYPDLFEDEIPDAEGE